MMVIDWRLILVLFRFQIRRAILQLLFPDKPFHWLRHIIIALCLLFVVNLLVIFVPNIRDIFGIIGEYIKKMNPIVSQPLTVHLIIYIYIFLIL